MFSFQKFLPAVFLAAMSLAVQGQSSPDERYFPLPQKRLEVVHSKAQDFMVDTLITGLYRPYSMVFLPDNSVLIAEREGKILIIKNGKLQDTRLGGDIPSGLRDMALHPDYANNGWIYLSFYQEPVNKENG